MRPTYALVLTAAAIFGTGAAGIDSSRGGSGTYYIDWLLVMGGVVVLFLAASRSPLPLWFGGAFIAETYGSWNLVWTWLDLRMRRGFDLQPNVSLVNLRGYLPRHHDVLFVPLWLFVVSTAIGVVGPFAGFLKLYHAQLSDSRD